MLEEPIKEGVPPKMKGSVLMCVADTEEEVLERVKKDVYYTNDVWDKEKVSAFARMGTWDVSIEDTKEKMEDYLVGCCSMYLADHLSRSRSFRSRALFGRHSSEHDRMNIVVFATISSQVSPTSVYVVRSLPMGFSVGTALQ